MVENIRLSFQGIWSHKMRSFLTMLGIIIGIASIISIVSTIKGTNEQIKRNLIGSGEDTVDVKLYEEDWEYEIQWNGVPEGVPVYGQETIDAIKEIEEVELVSMYNIRRYADGIFYKNTGMTGGSVLGIDSSYFKAAGYDVRTGRDFLESDYENFRKVVILDKVAASSLFQDEEPLGKTIEIMGEPYTVIGIAQKANEFVPVINSIDDYYLYMEDKMGAVFLPNSIWAISYGHDEPQDFVLKAKDTESMANAGRKTVEILNNQFNTSMLRSDTIKYKAANILEQARELQELSAATNQQLIWIASISLLVGGIGVMNIMLVSVTERTREIGLKKAIGARKSKILAQFLTEAAVLTSIGGLLGVAAGIILSQVISSISEAPVAISVPALLAAVIFSMLIGIIFGLLPSYKAANLNPIDALRHE